MTAQLARDRERVRPASSGRFPLAAFFLNRTIAWRLVPVALVWSLWEAFYSRSRPWAGDWVMGLTFTTAGFVFIAIVAGCVAAYDAGTAVNTEVGAAWDSVPRRLRDIGALWLAAVVLFLLVNIVTLMGVMIALALDGAAYGQTAAVVAQQWVILGFACALGVLLGVLQGPRMGSLTALVVGGYLIYWKGYVQRVNVPPTRSISATSPLIGLKLNEHLVLIQVAQAATWIVAALLVAAYARTTGKGHRRPTVLSLAVGLALVLGSGWAAGKASTDLPDPVPVSMSQRCLTESSTTVCLYQGHDKYITHVLSDVITVRHAAAEAGVGDLIPSRVHEVKALSSPAAGQLGYDGIGGSATSVRSILASLLPSPGACPAYVALDSLPAGSAEAAFPQVQADASSTLGHMLQGKPVTAWAMKPQRLRAYVAAVSRCDIAAAVRAS